MKTISRSEAQQAGLKQYFTGKPCARGHIAPRITANGSCHQCFLDDKRVKRSKKPGHRTREEMDRVRDSDTRECSACGNVFQSTTDFFQLVKVGKWQGLSSECRVCRNKRYGPYYKKHRKKLIARAIETTKNFRSTPEGKEKNREWSREQKRRELSDPAKRIEHVARAREWRHANPDKAKLFKHEQRPFKAQRVMRRYARKAHATPAWADQRKIETIYAIADFLTRKTGTRYDVDHVYPLMGTTCCGLHVPENMRVITRDKNQQKGNRLDPEFDTWKSMKE